jgi:hypothetical protein
MQNREKDELTKAVEEALRNLKKQKQGNKTEPLDVRAFLFGKTKEYFIEIKEEQGFGSNTETIRYIINSYHKLINRTESKKE